DGEKGKASAACPIDVVTGAMFTLELCDAFLPSTHDVWWGRQYRSSGAERSCGIGFGWWHGYAWRARVRHGQLVLIDGHGIASEHPIPTDEADIVAPFGRTLARRGDKLVVAEPSGLVRILSPHECGWLLLVAERDRHGNTIRIEHDASGAVVAVLDPVGRRIERTVDGLTQRYTAVAHDAEGREHRLPLFTYELDERGDLRRAIDAAGFAWEYRYDARHHLIEERRPDGLRFHFVYERKATTGIRRCLETWGDLEGADILAALGRETVREVVPAGERPRGIFHTRFEYVPDSFETTVLEGDGGTHRYVGNELGLVTMHVDARGNASTLTYDEHGNVLERASSTGGGSKTEWSPDGLFLRATDAGGGTYEVVRNDAGFPVELRTPLATSRLEYDVRHNVSAIVDPCGATTTLHVNRLGEPIEVGYPDGTRRTHRYDGHGNLVEVGDLRGWQTRCGYDPFGRLTEVKTRGGARWQLTNDRRGLTTRIDGPDGRSVHYEVDSLGRPVRVARSDGHVATFRYVADAVVEKASSGGPTVRYGFDALCRGLWIENGAGDHHLVRRDAAGNIVWDRTFAGIERRFRLDADERLEWLEHADGSGVAFEYDERGQLAAVDANGAIERYRYDAEGVLVGASNADVDVTLTRDPLGRLLDEAIVAAGFRYEVRHERDAVGRVVRKIHSTGWSLERSYAPDGGVGELRITSEDGAATLSVRRDAVGRVCSQQLGEASLATEYDALGRPTVVAARCGREELAERRYTWSPIGPVARVTDSRHGARSYELDASGRPTEVSGLGESSRFGYSAHGTPLPSEAEVRLGPDGRVVRNAAGRYRWDPRGRLVGVEPTEGSSWTHRYDAYDRLVESRRADGVRVENVFDPFGRRIAQRVGSDTVWFGWDVDAAVEEIDPRGRATRRVFQADGFLPLLERDGREPWQLVATDATGTPWLFFDERGVTGELDLTTSGATARSTGRVGRLRFAGQRADDLTGLAYQRFRFYAPPIGQFTSPDPLGLAASLQDVTFVKNPTLLLDPLGLMVVCFSDDPMAMAYAQERARSTRQGYLHYRNAQQGSLAGQGSLDLVTHGDPGVMQVGGNTGPNGAYDGNSGYIPAANVGHWLRNQGFGGSHINLLSCNGATRPAGGGASAAQQLADQTGATVTGANNYVYPYSQYDPAQERHIGPGYVGGAQPPNGWAPKGGGWETVGPSNQAGRTAPGGGPNPHIPRGFDPMQDMSAGGAPRPGAQSGATQPVVPAVGQGGTQPTTPAVGQGGTNPIGQAPGGPATPWG
ncbi:MAG: hypothetical protein FJ096_05325, partial [Deltaproteobacteria bacterium]|nr:hypothetical protein [Deltaproteobacteria bacterium]